MYELFPSEAWKKFATSRLPPLKRDARGREMEETDPEPGEEPRILRAFDILPDHVSSTHAAGNLTNPSRTRSVHWNRLC